MDCTMELDAHKCRTCYNATKNLNELKSLTQCNDKGGHQEQKTFAQLLKEISNINVSIYELQLCCNK